MTKQQTSRSRTLTIKPLAKRNMAAMALAAVFLVLLIWVIVVLSAALMTDASVAIYWIALIAAGIALIADLVALVTGEAAWFLFGLMAWGDR